MGATKKNLKVQANVRAWIHVQMYDLDNPDKGYARFDVPTTSKELIEAVFAAMGDEARKTVSRAGTETVYALCDVSDAGEVTLPGASLGLLAAEAVKAHTEEQAEEEPEDDDEKEEESDD